MVAYFQKQATILPFSTRQAKHDLTSNLMQTTIVAYVDPSNNAQYETFKKLSHVLIDEALVSVTRDAKVAKGMQLKQSGQFALFRPLESKIIYKQEGSTSSSGKQALNLVQLVQFVRKNKNQLVAPMRPDNVMNFVSLYEYLVVAYIDNMESPQTIGFLQSLKQLASELSKDLKKKVKITYAAVSTLFKANIIPFTFLLKHIAICYIVDSRYGGILETKRSFNFCTCTSCHETKAKQELCLW